MLSFFPEVLAARIRPRRFHGLLENRPNRPDRRILPRVLTVEQFKPRRRRGRVGEIYVS